MKITPQRPPASTMLSTEGKEQKKIDNTVENSTTTCQSGGEEELVEK